LKIIDWLLSSGPADWALLLVGFWAGRLAVRSLRAVEQQGQTAHIAALAAKTSADAAMLAERAYVSISHQLPGVEISSYAQTKAGQEHFGGMHDAEVGYRIKNSGNTPARITDIVLTHHVAESARPAPPAPIGPGSGESIYLEKGDGAADALRFQLSDDEVKALKRDDLRLWILGYVDYIDAFDTRRRGIRQSLSAVR
jgi:hypothetical protein